jgi:aminoglycoside phosphotransferase (APT) family kinase protein
VNGERAAFDRRQLDGIRDLLALHLGKVPGPISAVAAQGGRSNPTFFLTWPGGAAVLRKQPSGPLAPSAHAIDREYRLLSALADSPVPVPRPIHFHSDPDLLGTPFYLMEMVEGRIFDQATLPDVQASERSAMYRAMAAALADLHGFDWRAAGLDDFGRAGEYYPRQFRRWTRFRAEHDTIKLPDLDAVQAWLAEQSFPAEETAISHGDYRFANVMFAPDRPEVAAILDWELATLGPPAADLAFSATCYYTRPDENGGLVGIDLMDARIPDSGAYAESYFAAADRAGELSLFEQVFALFRAAAGSQSIALRADAGQGVGDESRAFGERMARAYARGARELLERQA